ncbi:hypothetical protein GGR32_001837 [Mesonia hippocampi]|uniref:DUF4249 domain-containing protein n=1 Tax=Mesonia hippocampi TaxID=1628250 RepID=A0A840ER54_9FLAO|nr:DUF4249 domain-containing protein [Mesonia hippocampi]MBB4119535.1 hypothetical protein [Mesonia hippocampi]
MKISPLTYLSIFFSFLLFSCEDVIEVDLKTGEPKLVIDAEIQWQKETDGSFQKIKLSRLTDYYNPTTPKVSNAIVEIQNSTGEIFSFHESNTPGEYICNNFIPKLNETYTLTVEIDNQIYTATENLTSVPEITKVIQESGKGISNEDISIAIFYQDPEDETNYYLTDFKTEHLYYREYILMNDDLQNGKEIEDSFSHEDLKPGDLVEITHRGISEQFYNYMYLILESTSGNPFATPPANIRGNIINKQNPDNYALGYFRLSEINHLTYTVVEEN